jgi:predicted metal-dependent hydrolase
VPASFSHPRANRNIHLRSVLVAFELRRSRRSTIGFTVSVEGLMVRAPLSATVRVVEAALQQKADWILRKLDEMQRRGQQIDQSRIVWKDGVVLPFLGQDLQVVLDPSHAFVGKGAALNLQHASDASAPRLLQVALPHQAQPVQIRDTVQAWLQRQARDNFMQRLHHFAPQLQVQWRRLSLSNAVTRWGSASSDGSIRLNWRLIHVRQPIIDYVVVHELSHLRVMDHSPRFWDTVSTLVPDYAELRAELKSAPVPRWA